MKKAQLNLYMLFFAMLFLPAYVISFGPALQGVGGRYVTNNAIIGLEALFFDYLGVFIFIIIVLVFILVGVFGSK